MRAMTTIGVRAVQGGRAGREECRPRGRCPGRPPEREMIAGRREGDRLSRRKALGAATRRVEVGLTPEAVEAVAERVAQLLADRDSQRQPEARPVTAGQLAHYLGVDRAWIYKHRHTLGGWRINDGPKAQWRFDLKTAKAGSAEHRLRRETAGA